MLPLVSPNICVASPVAIAYFGEMPINKKKGLKNIAPPIPIPTAIVDIIIETGKTYQY